MWRKKKKMMKKIINTKTGRTKRDEIHSKHTGGIPYKCKCMCLRGVVSENKNHHVG